MVAEGSSSMAGPRSLGSLHKQRELQQQNARRSQIDCGRLGDKLDDLLDAQSASDNPPASSVDEPVITPIERLRDMFANEFAPALQSINDKYQGKGVEVALDATDFVGGGRSIVVTIQFSDQKVVLEGTVTDNAIAFQETRYVGDYGGMMAGGPSLRTRSLDVQQFSDFILARIISLVKSVTQRSR
jgi:hypothetical protein